MIQCEAEINQFVADIWSTFVNMPVASTKNLFKLWVRVTRLQDVFT